MTTTGTTSAPAAVRDVASRYRLRRRAPEFCGVALVVCVLATFYSIGVQALPVAAVLIAVVLVLVLAMIKAMHWSNHIYPQLLAAEQHAHATAAAREQFEADWVRALEVARGLRVELITDADLPPCPPVDVVLAAGEHIHVWAHVTYAPRHDATDDELQDIDVAVTPYRLIALTGDGAITKPWNTVRAFATDLANGTLRIDAGNNAVVRLAGPQTLAISVYATAMIYGTERLLSDPAMLQLANA